MSRALRQGNKPYSNAIQTLNALSGVHFLERDRFADDQDLLQDAIRLGQSKRLENLDSVIAKVAFSPSQTVQLSIKARKFSLPEVPRYCFH